MLAPGFTPRSRGNYFTENPNVSIEEDMEYDDMYESADIHQQAPVESGSLFGASARREAEKMLESIRAENKISNNYPDRSEFLSGPDFAMLGHDEPVTKFYEVAFTGLPGSFEGKANVWKPAGKPTGCPMPSPNGLRYILYKVEVVGFQNTMPTRIGVKWEGVPALLKGNTETYTANEKDKFTFVIPSTNGEWVPMSQVLYERDSRLGLDPTGIVGWDQHTEETIEKSIIKKRKRHLVLETWITYSQSIRGE